jgi:phenylpyruvate tautomerase PptA (4-oxalocrotonate tautomerase family)
MAKVKGMKEKLHLPLYDAFFVPGARNGTPAKRLQDVLTDPRVIRFFVDVQNKTKLETNLQAAGVLPSLNTYEARAMRVVASTFCVPREVFRLISTDITNAAETYRQGQQTEEEKNRLVADILAAVQRVMGAPSLGVEVRAQIIAAADMYYSHNPDPAEEPDPDTQAALVATIADAFEAGCAAASSLLSELIYNSVTSLIVGEKIMIEVPTFYFPSGAGVSGGNGFSINHGEPDPMATFRFAEPVIIEPQQNFRVEMTFPQGVPGQAGTAGTLANVSGPLRIWVLMDGYLTRDVQ